MFKDKALTILLTLTTIRTMKVMSPVLLWCLKDLDPITKGRTCCCLAVRLPAAWRMKLRTRSTPVQLSRARVTRKYGVNWEKEGSVFKEVHADYYCSGGSVEKSCQ